MALEEVRRLGLGWFLLVEDKEQLAAQTIAVGVVVELVELEVPVEQVTVLVAPLQRRLIPLGSVVVAGGVERLATVNRLNMAAVGEAELVLVQEAVHFLERAVAVAEESQLLALVKRVGKQACGSLLGVVVELVGLVLEGLEGPEPMALD